MWKEIHKILKDPECAGNIRCFTWAAVTVLGLLSLLVYGFGLFEFSESLNADVDRRIKHSHEETVKKMESMRNDFMFEYLNHTHNYSTGKPNVIERTATSRSE